MKYRFLLFASCLFLISCKKDSTVQPLLEHWPQNWILTTDASADKYTYLELSGNSMKRSEVLKSYSLTQLALDNYCEFIVSLARTEYTNEICYKIQFERERKRWLFAGLSSNGQEVHLRTTLGNSETEDPGGDGYKFFIHDMPKVNGVKTVAIESVDKPGYYISTASPGLNYSPTQVVLTQHSNPDAATRFQCR
ncbi:MAG: hypothetical protein JNK14_18795 [Chitinophagaceae bacterium]|nr:hypothetical protein [Chitinophagaceae bacterium]